MIDDPMPVFTIKAQDKLATKAVRSYRNICIDAGLHEQALEVAGALVEMAAWRERHPELVKMPDHRHVPATADPVPPDGELPGMWEHADFMGGATDDAPVDDPAQPNCGRYHPPGWRVGDAGSRNEDYRLVARSDAEAARPDGDGKSATSDGRISHAADGDAYLTAARAMIPAVPFTDEFERKLLTPEAIESFVAARAARPDLRAAVDAARAPLLAEMAAERRKVEALLNGDKAMASRIWLAEECERRGRERDEARAEVERLRAEVARLTRISTLNPFGNDLEGACCVDAYASTGREHPEVLHTGGCPNRCGVHSPLPAGALLRSYPCALTSGHPGEHWLHPSYRTPVETVSEADRG